MGTPNILNLYRSPTIRSHAILRATNSLPNDDDSIVLCFFENQITGALLRKMIIPVCDLRVTTFPAWSKSTNRLCPMCFPRLRAFLVATHRPRPRKSLSMLITPRWQKHSHLRAWALGQVQYSISGVSSKMRRCGRQLPYVPPVAMPSIGT